MRAYEFPTKVTRNGQVKLPASIVKLLPNNEDVRAVLVKDADSDLDRGWDHLTSEQFFAGYSDADSIYDRI